MPWERTLNRLYRFLWSSSSSQNIYVIACAWMAEGTPRLQLSKKQIERKPCTWTRFLCSLCLWTQHSQHHCSEPLETLSQTNINVILNSIVLFFGPPLLYLCMCHHICIWHNTYRYVHLKCVTWPLMLYLILKYHSNCAWLLKCISQYIIFKIKLFFDVFFFRRYDQHDCHIIITTSVKDPISLHPGRCRGCPHLRLALSNWQAGSHFGSGLARVCLLGRNDTYTYFHFFVSFLFC